MKIHFLPSCLRLDTRQLGIYLFIQLLGIKHTFIVPSINVISLSPFLLMEPAMRTLKPCFRVGTVKSLWWSWPGPHQTCWTLSDPNKCILVSSDQRMCCYCSSGLVSRSLVKFPLAVLFCDNGFLLGRLDSSRFDFMQCSSHSVITHRNTSVTDGPCATSGALIHLFINAKLR